MDFSDLKSIELTIQQMFNEFLNVDHENHFFQYYISKTKNVYIKGITKDKNTIQLEMHGPIISNPDIARLLRNYGWEIGESSGTNIINSTMQEFKNGNAALFIFQSLRAYDLSYDDINFEGYEIKTL